MRIKHYGIFKNGMKSILWESLRNNETEIPYYLPNDKGEYLNKVEVNEPSELAQIIIQEIEKTRIKKIFSIGSGIAYLEYQLKKYSDLSVVVSDYNSSILRLKKFNVFDDALILNALIDPIPVDEGWVILFPRIDTEFSDDQLDKLFAICHHSGIKFIYFIPAELLSLRIIVAEIKVLLISILKNKTKTFCGYARSKGAFCRIWKPYYTLSKKYKCKNGSIFFLQSK